jgi:hypothetical protein
MKKIQEKFLKILKDEKVRAKFIQAIPYLLFVLVWVHFYFVDGQNLNGGKRLYVFFSLLLIFVTKVLFLKIKFRTIINWYLLLLIVMAIFFKIDGFDIVVGGLFGIFAFSTITIPWLFFIKMSLNESKNKAGKMFLLIFVGVICLFITTVMLGIFSETS